MFDIFNKKKANVAIVYNKIVSFSRNKFFYHQAGLNDTFQTRIFLIFFHLSFLFIKIKENGDKYKKDSQVIFDYTFKSIEINMRELGYGDVTVNKNMKDLIKVFYNILLLAESYKVNTEVKRRAFIKKYFTANGNLSNQNVNYLIDYFNNYASFCFEISVNSVLKGELNFKYKGME